MSQPPQGAPGCTIDQEVLESLKDLERQKPEAIVKQRKHNRLEIRCPVVARPGNSSDVDHFSARGVTADVSEGGCRTMFPVPLRVGDIYRLTFESETLSLPMVFVRCLRCRLVREDAFEVGFAFFTKIQLPQDVSSQTESLLA